MPVFRPSARSRLQLRIDEGTDTSGLVAALEQDAPTGATVMDTVPTTELGRQQELDKNRAERRLVTQQRALLSTTELDERTSRLDTRRNALQLGGATEQQKPQGLLATAMDDDRTIGVDVFPITAKIMRNGLLEADEATIDFDFRNVPIDPRVLRAVFLDLVIGVVSPDEFQLGVSGGTSEGDPLSVVARFDENVEVEGGNTRFVGYADDWSVVFDESGDMVTVVARDLTAPLIDRKLPTGVTIDMQKPIADGVQELVDQFNATRGLKVIFGNPPLVRDGSVVDATANRGNRGPVPAAAIPRTRKARKGTRARRAKSGDQAMSVWDHITDTVVATGFIPIIRGLEMYIIEPRTFYADASSPKQLVYGRNLSQLQFARKLGGASKVPTIEVRCADPDIGRTRWARAPVKRGQQASGVYGINDPPKANRANEISPGGSPSEEIKTIPISGVSDGATLERIAQSLFEQIGRQEMEGNFSTDDITSFGSAEEGDLLDLLPGDAVEMLIAPLNAASTGDSTNTSGGGSVNSVQELQSQTVGRRAAFLRSLGYPEGVANRLAVAQEDTNLQTTFRVQDVTISFSQEDGVSIEGDFINFLVVRESADAPQQAASLDVLAATAGSTSDAAAGMEAASSAGNTLGAQANSGQVSNEEYASQSTEERGRQQRATQAQRRSG